MFKSLIKKVRKSKGGFTLIELIAVIAILAILAIILIPTIGGQISKANDSKAKADANSAFLACQIAYSNLEAAGTTPTEANVKSGAASSYKGTISKVTLSSTGVDSVQISENGKTYTFNNDGTITVS